MKRQQLGQLLVLLACWTASGVNASLKPSEFANAKAHPNPG